MQKSHSLNLLAMELHILRIKPLKCYVNSGKGSKHIYRGGGISLHDAVARQMLKLSCRPNRRLSNIVAETPGKFQSDWTDLDPNFGTSRFPDIWL